MRWHADRVPDAEALIDCIFPPSPMVAPPVAAERPSGRNSANERVCCESEVVRHGPCTLIEPSAPSSVAPRTGLLSCDAAYQLPVGPEQSLTRLVPEQSLGPVGIRDAAVGLLRGCLGSAIDVAPVVDDGRDGRGFGVRPRVSGAATSTRGSFAYRWPVKKNRR